MALVSGCTTGPVTITGWGCFLMLNPMANGSNADVFLEYRGNAALPNSPCSTVGIPGGPGTTGPLVPTLVQ
jgi:hypothetical protein